MSNPVIVIATVESTNTLPSAVTLRAALNDQSGPMSTAWLFAVLHAKSAGQSSQSNIRSGANPINSPDTIRKVPTVRDFTRMLRLSGELGVK